MFLVISRLNNIANKLDDLGRVDLADKIDKITSEIKEAKYKPLFKRQIKSPGIAKIKRKLYYIKNKYKIKIRTKNYRTKNKYKIKLRTKKL